MFLVGLDWGVPWPHLATPMDEMRSAEIMSDEVTWCDRYAALIDVIQLLRIAVNMRSVCMSCVQFRDMLASFVTFVFCQIQNPLNH